MGENDVVGDWRGIKIAEGALSHFLFVDSYYGEVCDSLRAGESFANNPNGVALF
ncbi:MAG: hypothetical protein AB8B64_18790 [Granulosicoccus sp.]